jgi:hypothetical protein
MLQTLYLRPAFKLWLFIPGLILLLPALAFLIKSVFILAGILILILALGFVAAMEKSLIDYSKKTHEITLFVLFIPFKKTKSLEGFDTVAITFDFEEWGKDDYSTTAKGIGRWSSEINSYEMYLSTGTINKYFMTEYGDYKTARKLADEINEKLGYAILDGIAATQLQVLKNRGR